MINQIFKNLLERNYFGTEAAGTIIFAESTKRILFLKRSADEDSEQECWEFTIGGKKDKNEICVKSAASREMSEEIGKLTNIISFDIFDIFYDTNTIDMTPFKYYSYFMKVDKEFNPVLSDEHTDFKWVDIVNEELPNPLHFGVERLFNRVHGMLDPII